MFKRIPTRKHLHLTIGTRKIPLPVLRVLAATLLLTSASFRIFRPSFHLRTLHAAPRKYLLLGIFPHSFGVVHRLILALPRCCDRLSWVGCVCESARERIRAAIFVLYISRDIWVAFILLCHIAGFRRVQIVPQLFAAFNYHPWVNVVWAIRGYWLNVSGSTLGVSKVEPYRSCLLV